MGNAKLWYYPDPEGVVYEIDLGAGLTDLDEIPDDVVDVAEAMHGDQSRQLWRGRLRVRILLERFSGQSSAGRALARDLLSLRHHLSRGGSVALAADSAKAWCGWTGIGPVPAGATSLVTRGDPTSGWGHTGAVANGDEVVVFGAQPSPPYEWCGVSSLSGTRLTLTSGLRYPHPTRVGVRHRNFYPALILPADQAGARVVVPDRRTTYTLELELVEDIAGYDSLSAMVGGQLRGTTNSGGKRTVDGSSDRNRPGGPLGQAAPRWSR